MYQHVFWFYSHPAVYIMMLPGFGHQRGHLDPRPQAGVRLPDDGVLTGGDRDPRLHGLGASHVRVRDAGWIRIPMMITTMLIAVPTGIKIFSWLATLWRGVIHLRTPMLFALGFITMFTLGGISGIMLAVVPFDIHVSDTYFIVAHIHYVLFGGSVFTIFAGLYHWFPKMTGRMYDESLGRIHFWLSFVFFNLTFGPMHFVGIDGMPRRVADYSEQFATWNAIISISAFIFGLSFLIFLYNIIASWRHGPPPRATPGGRTRSSGRCPPRRRCSASTRSRRWSAAPTSTACRERSTRSSRRRSPLRRARCRRRPAEAALHRQLTNEARPRGGERDGGGKPLIDAVGSTPRARTSTSRDQPAEPAEARLRDLRRVRARRRRRTGSR